MNEDGSNQTNLTNNAAGDTQPAVSPDGTKIAFTTDRDGNSEIYFMDSHGNDPYNLSGNPAFDFGVTWAPDPYINRANRAFTTDREGNDEIYEMSYLGLYQWNLTNSAATERSPSYSPDGTKIAFMTTRNLNPDIYVMNRDGSSPVQLTKDASSDFDADWAKKAAS